MKQKVYVPAKSQSNKSCKWGAMHQYCLKRRSEEPAVVNVMNFPDSGETCDCNPRLFLKSVDVNEKDFSKVLCELLGLDKSYLFIETDGLTRNGVLRLVSILTSMKQLFDNRLAILLVSEEKLNVEEVKKWVEREYNFTDRDFDLKKLKSSEFASTRNSEKKTHIDEDLKKTTESENSSDKDTEIRRIKNELISLENKSLEDEAKYKKRIDEINEKNKELLVNQNRLEQSLVEKSEALQNLKSNLDQAVMSNKDLLCQNKDIKILANEHLDERNLRLKELESKREEIAITSNILTGKDETISNLKLKCAELNDQNQGRKCLEDQVQKEQVTNKKLRKEIDELQVLSNQRLEERNSFCQEVQETKEKLSGLQASLTEFESKYSALEGKSEGQKINITEDLDLESKAKFKDIKEDIKKTQLMFPRAGSAEILHRGIKRLLCTEIYNPLVAGGYECVVSIVRGSLLAFSSLSSFKGRGTSKNKAKVQAFDSYLSLLLNSV